MDGERWGEADSRPVSCRLVVVYVQQGRKVNRQPPQGVRGGCALPFEFPERGGLTGRRMRFRPLRLRQHPDDLHEIGDDWPGLGIEDLAQQRGRFVRRQPEIVGPTVFNRRVNLRREGLAEFKQFVAYIVWISRNGVEYEV